jgi:transposase
MVSIKQIIRLKVEGQSNRHIHLVLGIGRRTVNKYVKQLECSGLSYKELQSLEENDLIELFDSTKGKNFSVDRNRHQKAVDFFPYMDTELCRLGVTRWHLWAEYRQQHPEGYNYSRFCKLFNDWKQSKDVSMHIEHKAGDKLYIDYTGKRLEVVDQQTGEVKRAEVFVAVLGASQYTYVEASYSQKKEDFIGALENAFIFYGGVTKAVVCDNLRSAVDKSSRYEPKINETLADFALHYNTAIVPARVRKPKDKSLVENGVRIIYYRIFAPLRNRMFFSLEELNRAIQEELGKHNDSYFQGKSYGRKTLFETIEKQELSELPPTGYELKKISWISVQKNGHVCLGEDKHYYSVPFQYVGKKVKLLYSRSTIEVYCSFQRIAFHKRNYQRYKYSTERTHMASTHQFISDWSAEFFTTKAAEVGPETETFIKELLEHKQYPEQGFKSSQGILNMAKKVGYERMNNACRRALYYESYFYGTIESILLKELDKIPIHEEENGQMTIPLHDNIRGQNYYK